MSTKPLTFAPRELSIERRADGTLILRSPLELGLCDWRITEFLPRWASAAADRIFLAQRNAKRGWDEITYREAWLQVQAVGQSLIDMGAKPADRLAVLSGNSIENAVISFAAMSIGVDSGANIAELHADARRPCAPQGHRAGAAAELRLRSERTRLFRGPLHSRIGERGLDQRRWCAGYDALPCPDGST